MTDYWPLLILAAVILGCILARLWITPTWGTVRDTGVWHYQRNRKTGERRVCGTSFDGYQPVVPDGRPLPFGRSARGGLLHAIEGRDKGRPLFAAILSGRGWRYDQMQAGP
jgi:hypothetical protein